MKPSRIHAVDHVHLEAPPGIEEALKWFYGELGTLDEVPWDGAPETGLCFKSARIELRIRITNRPTIDEVKRRVTLLVPSLSVAKEQLSERAVGFIEVTGMVGTDRRVQTLDPAGNRVELKQEWPFAPI